jgi:peptide alpha-N-acetyltransferase
VAVTEKYLQAIKSLLKARSLDPENPELHIRTVDLHNRGSIHPSHGPSKKLTLTWTVLLLPQPPPEPIGPILAETLHTLLPGDVTVETFNSQYLQRHSSFPLAVLAAAKASGMLGVQREELEDMVFTTLDGTLLDIKVVFIIERPVYHGVSCAHTQGALSIISFLGELHSPRTDEYRIACQSRFPLSTVFKSSKELLELQKRMAASPSQSEEDPEIIE